MFTSLGQVLVPILPLVLLALPTLALPDIAEQATVNLNSCCSKRNASINLYPKSILNTYPRTGPEDTRPHDNINLAVDVCLSGDYPLQRNLQIVHFPICPDGSLSVSSLFPNRRCNGRPSMALNNPSIGGSWPNAPYYWSLIFRCGVTPYIPVVGNISHVDAVPPTGPTKGRIQFGGRSCGLYGGDGGSRTTSLEVDTCHRTLDYGIRFQDLATCKNGTRAQWARFSDDKCKAPMSEGLLDINDSDTWKCQPLGSWGTPQELAWKVGSMAFWCDGIKDSKDSTPKPRPAAISTDVCNNSPNFAPSPTFKYLEPDTCIETYSLGTNFRIYENAICPNGTSAVLSKFRYGGCYTEPECLTEVGDDLLDKCLDSTGYSSYSFRCTGVISRPIVRRPSYSRGNRARDQKAKAILIAGIVMLSIGCALILAVAARAFFKNEKLRKKWTSIFRRSEGTIVLT